MVARTAAAVQPLTQHPWRWWSSLPVAVNRECSRSEFLKATIQCRAATLHVPLKFFSPTPNRVPLATLFTNFALNRSLCDGHVVQTALASLYAPSALLYSYSDSAGASGAYIMP